jgi:hypothetical protein
VPITSSDASKLFTPPGGDTSCGGSTSGQSLTPAPKDLMDEAPEPVLNKSSTDGDVVTLITTVPKS